jgi:hypothetical protein
MTCVYVISKRVKPSGGIYCVYLNGIMVYIR